jgi:hypothetical protein
MVRAFLAALLFLSLACLDPSGPVCTLIGCLDSVVITFQGPFPPSYRIVLTEEGTTQPLLELECTPEAPCAEEVFLDVAPTAVRVELVTELGTQSGTFTPSYTTVRPNGPDCPPECLQGRLAVSRTDLT